MKRLERIKIIRVFLLFCFCIGLYIVCVKKEWFYGDILDAFPGWYGEDASFVENINEDIVLKQEFSPTQSILKQINVFFGETDVKGHVLLKVYNAKNRILSESNVDIDKLNDHSMFSFLVNITVVKGQTYYYTIEFTDLDKVYPTHPFVYEASYNDSDVIGDFYINENRRDKKLLCSFVYQEGYENNITYGICLLFTILMGIFTLIWEKIPRIKTKFFSCFVFIHGCIGYCIIEFIIGNSIYGIGLKKGFCNILVCIAFFCLFSVIFIVVRKYKAPLFAGTIACFAIGVAEYYVLEFRGSPLLVSDIFSIGTAKAVWGNYIFDITDNMIAAVCIIILQFVLYQKVEFIYVTLKEHIFCVIQCIVLLVGSMEIVGNTDYMSMGASFFWDMKSSYEQNGYLLSTMINEKYQDVDEPDNYSVSRVEEILSSNIAENDKEANITQAELPNIIVIMNESWTFFQSTGGLETTEPLSPFVDSLSENTIKGDLYISVFGGGTSNTEFEFLTGNTQSFLPNGSMSYQTYIKDEIPSIAKVLKKYGYSLNAVHLAEGSNWNRNHVYPLLGFERFDTIDDVEDVEYIRCYPSDEFNFNHVIQMYNEWKKKDEKEHFFCFNVTIQNHGGYKNGYLTDEAPLLKSDNEYPDVNEFLSLIKDTDEAFQRLVNYFANEEEPVIILMFGDHWPSLDETFIQERLDSAEYSCTLEKVQNRYVTPFVLWANYDIEEKNIERISANFLSTLLLKTAGIPLPDYYVFLDHLSERIPVINAIGYIDANDNYYGRGEESIWSELINDYQILQYNNLFGKNKRVEGAFE